MSEETCTCCGAVIPEGRQVCRVCEIKAEEGITMGQHKYNPTALKASKQEIPPKEKWMDKAELRRLIYRAAKQEIAERMERKYERDIV